MSGEHRPLNGSIGSLKSSDLVGGEDARRGGGTTELREWPSLDSGRTAGGPFPLPPSTRDGSRRGDANPYRSPPISPTSNGDSDSGRRKSAGGREGPNGTAVGAERRNGHVGGVLLSSDAVSWFRDGVSPQPPQPPILYVDEEGTTELGPVASVAHTPTKSNGSSPPTPKTSAAAGAAGAADDMNFPRVPNHQRVSVIFEDLEVSARQFFSKEKKKLLHGVSGEFRAGELVAVMGPSGAGKTTLLNTLSGFTSGMVSAGSLRLQHEDGRTTRKSSAVCYLTQEDHVQPLFTVREAVMHAADLKVGSRLSRKARSILVDDIIETLGLEACRYTRASQLSGGQRKRLALAAELVDNPYVIFLDEPTTGLDMSTATQCTQLMRRIARSGRAVICTIHQPSENMLTMFDQVYILSEGHCVYRGRPDDILVFLNSLGYHCPQYHSPADFVLEVANNEYGNAVPAMTEAVTIRSSEYPPPLPEIKEYEANGKVNGNQKTAEMEALISVDTYPPSEWERFRVLVTRNLLLQHRDWISTHIKLVSAIFVALMVGLMFGPIGDNADRVISNISLFFMLSLYVCYCPEAPAVMKYADEIQVVKREWFNNWYRLYTYSFALLISSLPMHVMVSTALCSIAYYMTGQLAEPLRFAHVTMALILTSIASESLGLQFGSLFLKKKIISLFIASTHLAYLIIFSGLFALKSEMPGWFEWGTSINHMHYSVNSMILASYKDRARITCPEDITYCHLRDPESILKLFGLSDSEIWKNLLALVVFTIILRIAGYITLNYNVKRVNI